MLKLYEIADEYKGLLSQMYDAEELTEEHLKELRLSEEALEKKALACGAFIKNLEAEEAAIEDAIAKLTARKHKLALKKESMYHYLKYHMTNCGIKKISSPYFNLNLRDNPVSLIVEDTSHVPDEFIVRKEVKSVDKVKLKRALIEGLVVQGCELKAYQRLEIK
jgi:hypothetical protein